MNVSLLDLLRNNYVTKEPGIDINPKPNPEGYSFLGGNTGKFLGGETGAHNLGISMGLANAGLGLYDTLANWGNAADQIKATTSLAKARADDIRSNMNIRDARHRQARQNILYNSR